MAGGFQRAAAFDGQGFGDGVFEATREIGLGRLVRIRRQRGEHGGLETRKTEVETRPVGHRPRKLEHARAAVFREPRELRAAGIGQAEQLGGLVEGLAHRVVEALAEQGVSADAAHVHQ